MEARHLGAAVAGLAALLAVALVASAYVPATLLHTGDAYGSATVTVVGENGTELGVVDTRIADTRSERITGLSDTDSLPKNTGMLFVHVRAGEQAYVMRDMDFPLDIVFVGANHTITAIHEAPLPPPGTDEANLTRYRGTAKWVLEVNRGWTDRNGVTVGDRVAINYTG
ncbi:MAG: DUF192 domain-containing protein [Halobacteriaceae archaeon]